MSNTQAWLSVAGTIMLTLCGQLLIKWRVGHVVLPTAPSQKIVALLWLLADPWVLAAMVCAFAASLFWMSAMTRLPLSVAYPFTCLPFVIVTLLGGLLLQEPLTVAKLSGVLLVAAGLFILSYG